MGGTVSTYAYFDGVGDVAVSNLTTAITGDLDVRVKARATDWTPAGSLYLASHAVDVTHFGWGFRISSTGQLGLLYSTDGSTIFADISTANLSTVGVVDNETSLWVRVTLDADNGAAGRTVRFYTSTDGSTWTQLGNAVTTAGTVTPYSPAASGMRVGALYAGGGVWAGRIHSATILSGIDGTVVAAPDFSASPWDVGETVNVDAQGNTWTLTGAVIRSDQTATLDAAVRTRIAGELTVTPGTCSLTLDPAVRIRTAGDLTVSPGVCAVTLDAAHRIRTANDLTIGQGTAAMLHPIRASGRYKQNRARIRIYP